MEKKGSVIIFSTAYLPYLGGAELAIKEITDRIHDVDFFLITARLDAKLPRQERMGNVEVYRMGLGIGWMDKLLLPFLGMLCVRRILQTHAVLCFWGVMISYASITPVLLKMFGFYKKIPFLLTLQEGDSEEHIAKRHFGLISFFWKYSLKHANRVQVISTYLGDMARKYGYTGKVSVIPNGVDLQKFPVKNRNIKNTIITVSRLVEKNAIDILIQAFAEVRKQMPDARLLIIGDGPLRSNLQSLAGDGVTFAGSLPNEQVPHQLAQASIFVRPSRSEGLGISFLEAMAVGLPVVATRVGGIPDFLEHEKTGLFAAVDDSEDVAKQIIRLLKDDALYNQLAENGRKLIEQTYSWDAIAPNMQALMTQP